LESGRARERPSTAFLSSAPNVLLLTNAGYRAGGALLPLGDGAGQGLPPGLLAEVPPSLLLDVEEDELEFDPPPFGAVVPDPVVPDPFVRLVAPGTVPQGELLGEVEGLFVLPVDGCTVPLGVDVPGEVVPGVVPGFPLVGGFWVPVGGVTDPDGGVTVPVGGEPEFGDELWPAGRLAPVCETAQLAQANTESSKAILPVDISFPPDVLWRSAYRRPIFWPWRLGGLRMGFLRSSGREQTRQDAP
jgi:hypothetical protein